MRKFTKALPGAFLACVLWSPAVQASEETETLKTECHKQLNLGESGCNCIAERADQVLNPKQQALVVAMVTKDQAKSGQLRGDMTVDEMSGAAEFMMTAPQLCAS